jgi:hypothetical protein
MKSNSCFNFKLSKGVGAFGCYKRGMTGYNEWKTEKRHKSTNIDKLKRLEL